MTKHQNLFTPRQLTMLMTFGDMIDNVHERLCSDACRSALSVEEATEYANAVVTYLSLAVSKLADYNSSLALWSSSRDQAKGTFARQVMPITWDFAEVNTFAKAAGDLAVTVDGIGDALERLQYRTQDGDAVQRDAVSKYPLTNLCISTDPPYYDNVPYADLSDYFYIWLRRSLFKIYPELFGTLLVPKAAELVADFYRHGGQQNAQKFFEDGLGRAFQQMQLAQHRDYPLTIFYAFRQTESEDDEEHEEHDESIIASTGWETMLEGLIGAGFSVNGTWPIRTERGARSRSIGSNALASSIVLVCRPRSENAPVTTRREFVSALRRELPDALRKLQHGNIAPVDLAQAAIGPGMAVFSRYRQVVESNGEPMRVRTALQLINQALDEVLAEQEGEYDNDTRWAIDWFTQFGIDEAKYGDAETLSKAKNTSVQGLVEAGVVQARGGKVKLVSREQLPEDWNPTQDKRKSVWEMTQHLIRALEQGGEYGAAAILAQLGPEAEAVRDLAYRLYTVCERKGWAQEALAYNSLVVAWPGIVEQQAALPGVVGQSRLDI